MQSALSARRLSNDSIVMDRYALIKFSLLDKEIKTKEHAALFVIRLRAFYAALSSDRPIIQFIPEHSCPLKIPLPVSN